jgi:hypothetical protein
MASRKSTDLANFTLRLREDLRRRLERDAKKGDRSLNAEIVERLERSYEVASKLEEALGGGHTAALLQILASEIQLMEKTLGSDWTKDEKTAMAVGQAIARTLSPTMPSLAGIEFVFSTGDRVVIHRPAEATKVSTKGSAS